MSRWRNPKHPLANRRSAFPDEVYGNTWQTTLPDA